MISAIPIRLAKPAKLQRRRIRLGLGPWILDASVGIVPNRIRLVDNAPPDPCFVPRTFYGRLRIRRWTEQKALVR